jgi:hypothetical protein
MITPAPDSLAFVERNKYKCVRRACMMMRVIHLERALVCGSGTDCQDHARVINANCSGEHDCGVPEI